MITVYAAMLSALAICAHAEFTARDAGDLPYIRIDRGMDKGEQR